MGSGISARLIQSDDGFDLYHLAELRYFLKRLKGEGLVLDETLWLRAKVALKRVYQRSACLPLFLKILETWESSNSTKYRSDLALFLHESKSGDFYEETEGTVCVSAVHKAQGRELDRVWLLLNRYDFPTDEKKRTVYVGMTRAKGELHIDVVWSVLQKIPTCKRCASILSKQIKSFIFGWIWSLML